MTDKKARSVKHLTEDERPCERLIAHGPASLSNSQPLAIIIKKGKGGPTAPYLAMSLLVKFNFPDIGTVGRMP